MHIGSLKIGEVQPGILLEEPAEVRHIGEPERISHFLGRGARKGDHSFYFQYNALPDVVSGRMPGILLHHLVEVIGRNEQLPRIITHCSFNAEIPAQ